MGTGKLETNELERLVFPHCGVKRPETVIGPAVGEDSCALDLGGDLVVLTTDPITGAQTDGGWLAIQVSCNDLAATGADPVAILLTILLKDGSDAAEAREIMKSAERAARELNVQIVGGHTEITRGLPEHIVSVTAVGRATKEQLVSTAGVRPGDQLVLTKGAGIEGTAIFCWDYPVEVEAAIGAELAEQGRSFSQKISVVPDARIARNVGVHSMHDVTEGGVLGGAYEMAQGAGLGLTIRQDAILVSPPTRALCDALKLDPLKLISSGSLLIATPRGKQVVDALELEGIQAAVIGEFHREEQMELITGGRTIRIEPPEGDELWVGKAHLDRVDANDAPAIIRQESAAKDRE